ncbi:phosphoribosylglycinamide synthetase [Bifidobacterium sp.]|uniref:phosphoribosylglycinamide synthetase n=1 Tax=Bifidobacterium sp. TaxID=41200 RepID=UPI0025BB4DFB|nr:phosphoribosylglycinamide synthetase [Bifidobacterium sp.]MCH4209229.1 phosphoribosylglycinamide synthetase [Bifidobacterium sp.]MCI1224660.1 phosphoribosylglycinamide synthetase [Bifidobacterium sp.]
MTGSERLAVGRGIDLNDQRLWLKIASERLSIVRYVFLVQVEDGIASAAQRAALEYADAVLIGWPDNDSPEVRDLEGHEFGVVRNLMAIMERHIAEFTAREREGEVDAMGGTLVHITDCVAQVRRMFQPDFPLPTFDEISKVVQEEWDEDMGRIDSQDGEPSLETIEKQTEHADEHRGEMLGGDGARAGMIANASATPADPADGHTA